MSNLRTQNYNSNPKTDLKQRSYRFSLDLIQLVSSLPNQKFFWSFGDQLFRSGTSIGANIIEAKASSSKREFIKFYEISLKSANETKYWLSLLLDSKVNGLNIEKLKSLLQETTELANMLGSSLLTMKGKKF